MNRDDEIGGVLCQEIMSSIRPYSASELATKVHVREDKAKEMLQKLCETGFICCIDDKYLAAEKVPQKDVEAEAHGAKQCQTKKAMEDMQVEQATPPAGLPDSGGAGQQIVKRKDSSVQCAVDPDRYKENEVPQKDGEAEAHGAEQFQTKKAMEDMQVEQATPPAGLPVSLVTDSGGAGQQIYRRNDLSMQCAVDPDRYKENEVILRKIIDLLSQETGQMKSTTIAQKTGIGTRKSDVNRYLYFLEKQEVLSRDKTNFAMKKTITDEELKGFAAQLAKIPEGKKKTTSSSTDHNTDCTCPNRGPNCNHFHQHIQQNVTKIHVGNNVFMGSEH